MATHLGTCQLFSVFSNIISAAEFTHSVLSLLSTVSTSPPVKRTPEGRRSNGTLFLVFVCELRENRGIRGKGCTGHRDVLQASCAVILHTHNVLPFISFQLFLLTMTT
ncbi:hypothetical protein ABKN59_010332 [Abortiporus biennis]